MSEIWISRKAENVFFSTQYRPIKQWELFLPSAFQFMLHFAVHKSLWLFLSPQTVDRPKDWYKTMFKQIHKVHKAGKSVLNHPERQKRPIIWYDLIVRHYEQNWSCMHAVCMLVCLCVSLCACACRILLNQKTQRTSEPELIRWQQESLERRRNWEKPLIVTELSWEICSNFVGSHSQYKACLFVTAQASSTAAHTHTHAHYFMIMCA